ncbi:hypothetical protein TrispH2_003623 [Trichoplax sp. H2]|nr:hypothetical protein TrispH2_003623 [Trichoplax sp. H2]|eukprot:RDD45568.1 hypothetical protein TrispH2_003623 [Trichoplax sp. H2]
MNSMIVLLTFYCQDLVRGKALCEDRLRVVAKIVWKGFIGSIKQQLPAEFPYTFDLGERVVIIFISIQDIVVYSLSDQQNRQKEAVLLPSMNTIASRWPFIARIVAWKKEYRAIVAYNVIGLIEEKEAISQLGKVVYKVIDWISGLEESNLIAIKPLYSSVID